MGNIFVSEFMFLSIKINPLCGLTRGGKNKPDPADLAHPAGEATAGEPERREEGEESKQVSEQCSSGAREGVTNILCTGPRFNTRLDDPLNHPTNHPSNHPTKGLLSTGGKCPFYF